MNLKAKKPVARYEHAGDTRSKAEGSFMSHEEKMMETEANAPTPEQLEALKRFAAQYGRYWKCRLVTAWMTGNDERLPDAGLLRQVRNQLGPVWLRNARLGLTA